MRDHGPAKGGISSYTESHYVRKNVSLLKVTYVKSQNIFSKEGVFILSKSTLSLQKATFSSKCHYDRVVFKIWEEACVFV